MSHLEDESLKENDSKMTRQLLNEVISLKNKTEISILKQLIVLFIIILCFWLPPFIILKLVEGNLMFFIITWIVVSFFACLWIRNAYLKHIFPEEMLEYNKNMMKHDVNFIIFYNFRKNMLKKDYLINKKDEIISLIKNYLSIYHVSIIEHKFSIFILGIFIGLIGNFINNVFWHFSSTGGQVNIKIYSLYILSTCYLLIFTWFCIAPGTLDTR